MRVVKFHHSDVDGRYALKITECHSDGSIGTVELFDEELRDAVEISEAGPPRALLPAEYSSIRECLGQFVGRTIEDITQHDADEFAETGRTYIQLLLSGGDYLKIYITPDGFEYTAEGQ